jgi:exodeoxyribonuclease V gamma subunit
MNGSVTFCSMETSRSIPTKVLCLIGMNDNSYPRFSYEPGFNLIIAKPKKGDPSNKNEDRYLFLETLICAKENLYISYIGQHIRDNSIIPPSVIVSELMDYLEETFGEELRKHLITTHPLHPFSPDYFLKSSELFSYSNENLKCAEKLFMKGNKDTPFIESPLPLPDPEFKNLTLKDLSRFFTNPSKYILQERLNLSLEIQEESFEDRESFALKGLERYQVDQAILNGRSVEFECDTLFSIARSNGSLPHGTVGEYEYEKAFKTISDFSASLEKHLKDKEPQTLQVEINLGDFTLKSSVNDLFENQLVKYRCAKIKPKDMLSLWIEHLAFGAASDTAKENSILAGLDQKRKFEAWEYFQINNSKAVLESLLSLYYKGLTKPLSFFPSASFTYAEKIINGKDEITALQAAKTELLGTEYISGDLNDPYLNLCFKNRDSLDKEFMETAITAYGPLLENRKKLL